MRPSSLKVPARWPVITLLVVGALVGATALAMAPRDDALGSPEAIIVLGGAGPERADLGIELSETYEVPLVLSSSAADFAADRGYHCPPALCVVTDPETTIGEAEDISALVEERGWDEVTVVTTRFHTTRARVLFRQCLGDRVRVVGAERADDRGGSVRRWLNEIGGIVVGTTVDRPC
jgi:hypothetical protein